MQNLILLMVVVVTTVPFLVKLQLLPGKADFLPEVIGAVALIAFVARGVREQFRYVRPIYWIVLGALLVNMICGVLVNHVDAGPVFAGIRSYLRAIPLFLLPAAYAFSEGQVERQLSLLLKIALVQVPIAAFQRMQPYVTGDSVYGTLVISSFLSMFLMCVACLLTGFYFRGRLSASRYLVLLVLVLAPTTFNETKGTLILLPLALLVTAIVGTTPGLRLQRTLAAGALSTLFLAAFIPIYDYSQKDYSTEYMQGGRTISEYFVEGRIEGYLYGGAKGVGASRQVEVRRLDALVIPIQYLARDPVHLVFGLGIGNASHSALGRTYTGKYYHLFEFFLLHSASRLIIETGLLGLGLVLYLLWVIAGDARRVARYDQGVIGALAVGWVGCVVVLAFGLFWKDIIASAPLGYLFWYFSGLVVAHRMRLARTQVGSAVGTGERRESHVPARTGTA